MSPVIRNTPPWLLTPSYLSWYLYKEKFKDVALDDRPDFDVWKHTWSTQDKSRDSPKQENTFDCGTFVMISIYLISRGVRLQRSSYTQNGVTRQELRCSIAYVISQDNELLPASPDHNPLLPSMSKPIAYIDVFIDNFLNLSHQQHYFPFGWCQWPLPKGSHIHE